MDSISRRGKRHSNCSNDVTSSQRETATLIRSRYEASVSIILRLDDGFLQEKDFAVRDVSQMGFVATEKAFELIKDRVAALRVRNGKRITTDDNRGVMTVSPANVSSGRERP